MKNKDDEKYTILPGGLEIVNVTEEIQNLLKNPELLVEAFETWSKEFAKTPIRDPEIYYNELVYVGPN